MNVILDFFGKIKQGFIIVGKAIAKAAVAVAHFFVAIVKGFVPFWVRVGKAIGAFFVRVAKGFVPFWVRFGKGFVPFWIRFGKGFVPFWVRVGKGTAAFFKQAAHRLTHMTRKDWLNVWDKVTTAFLLILFASPFGILAYILIWFVTK